MADGSWTTSSLRRLALVLGMTAALAAAAAADVGAWTGPLAGWANARAAYGAVGDGRADDTAALQRALNELGAPGKPCVLYLPAGAYRITAGLTMTSHINVSVLGEDPAKTVIRWDGPADGTMLACNGVRYSRFGRITWDGAKRAGCGVMHNWDGHTPGAGTHNEHADERFVDLAYGIRGGSGKYMDAECPILRCRFLRCTAAGVSIENFNALDWWVWNCRFEDCRVGVTNYTGAGHFHVYDCVFLRSTETDLCVGNTSYFSFRRNLSIGSATFFWAEFCDCGAPTTIQGNRIYVAKGPAIQQYNRGSLILLDNLISTTSGPAVRTNCDTVSVGNTYSVAKPLACRRLVAAVDDRIVPASRLRPPAVPAFVEPAPDARPRVVELRAGSTAAAIQRAVAAAVRPTAIHLPNGLYPIDRTITIPAGRDVRLVGDGYGTILRWAAKDAGPVLRLAGPSRASLDCLTVDGGGVATAVAIDRCDQAGARVFMEQGEVSAGSRAGLLAERLARCDVSLHDFEHSGCKSVAVKVIGAGRPDGWRTAGGRVCIFGGASSDNALSYDVSGWGSLMAQDIWYEGPQPRFMRLTGSGTFTLNGGQIACADPNHGGTEEGLPAIELAGFRGRLTLMTAIMSTRLRVTAGGPATQVLALGLQGNGDTFFLSRVPSAKTGLVASMKYYNGGGATNVPDAGATDPAFLRAMLEQVRAQRPRPVRALPPGVTDVRIHRVNARSAPVCFHLR